MKSADVDLSTILDRILDTAADNFRVAKILVQVGLDPNNITYDAIFKIGRASCRDRVCT